MSVFLLSYLFVFLFVQRLWRLLADTALEQLDFAVAEKVRLHCHRDADRTKLPKLQCVLSYTGRSMILSHGALLVLCGAAQTACKYTCCVEHDHFVLSVLCCVLYSF